MPPPPFLAHKALLLLSLSLALAHEDGSNQHHQFLMPIELTMTNDLVVDDDGSSSTTCAAVVQDVNVTTTPDFTDDLNAWGVRQWIGFDHVARKAMEVVESTKLYMMSIEKNNGDYDKCRNKDVLCTYYAANNECDRGDVTENCSPVCQTCERLALGYDDYQVPYGGPNQQLIAYGDPDSALVQVEKTMEYMKTIDYKCLNKNELCVVWAVEGECKANPIWMAQNCAPECQTCEQYEDDGEEMSSDWGPTQWKELPDDDQFFEYDKEAVLLQLDRTCTYMIDKDKSICVNKDERCAIWASAGECEKNTQWMETNCAPECQSCDTIQTYEQRCPFDVDDLTTALQPGDLHRLFERIVNDVELIEQYGPLSILSSPNTTNGPWVITLDNFLSGEECDRFIDIGTEQGYQRSHEVGEYNNADGTYENNINERRTSTNSWCSARCYGDEYTKHVFPRIERLTGINRDHSEALQLLRYEVGQKYNNHHDFIEHETNRMQGPRILTVFMYLNNVEAGGGTRFERLHNLTVTPKRGRVVMWPSVLNEMPRVMDPRTHHEALPVESGEKYGANSWIHLNDLVAAEEEGCT